jgi:hypothetical protein
MPNLNARRFSAPDTLGKIQPDCLLEWLEPARAYLTARGVLLPATASEGRIDLEVLAGVFMEPEPEMPPYLVDSLHLVNDMADGNGMDAIQDAFREHEPPLEAGEHPDPADVAVRAWLLDRALLEEVHVQHQLTRPRSFEYFAAEADPPPEFEAPGAETLRALEARLDHWYAERKRGRGCRVRAFPREGECWFLVRHGQPCKREGVMDGDGTGSVFYRPQKHDVLVYNEERGEMRINCCGKRELQEFLKAFGAHVFGNENFFPGTRKYRLAPLLTGRDCLACGDVAGLESVTLREVEFFFGGKPWQRVTRKSADIFDLLEREAFRWPAVECISRASFIGANKAQYGRDEDSVIIEAWLKVRKFIAEDEDDEA